ncbi:MAG TPA: ribulose-bisphosphate carboxylase large subunit family protein [Candidatus Limnocylindrales bacterium]|nr:ribulose-bisphosphate carboxylase large subunit family protein [Candidatus Limnocylindrales bacterium]
MGEPIRATFLIETPYSLTQAVDKLVSEQTIGSFVDVPGEAALRDRFRGRVELQEALPPGDHPSLTGPYCGDEPVQRARVVLSYPGELIADDLFTLLAVVLGNGCEIKEISGLRLLDLDVPKSLSDACPRPQFGVEGTRRLAGVVDRPIIGSIIKPSVGLTPEQTASMVQELAEAGIDFVKDDELITSPDNSPLEKRVKAVMRVINDHAERTGKKVMFAFNISHDHLETMLRNHDTVLEAGGTCVMLSLHQLGYAGVMKVRRHSQLPILGHRNGWGLFTRAPLLGMDFQAYQKIWRLIGVDHLQVNAIRNKFWEPDESVVRSIKAMLTPDLDGHRALPALSSGQWGGQAPDTYKFTQTVDLLYMAGGGIQGHPAGPAAGVRAIQQAWEAAVQAIPLETYAATHQELAGAIERFGKRENA